MVYVHGEMYSTDKKGDVRGSTSQKGYQMVYTAVKHNIAANVLSSPAIRQILLADWTDLENPSDRVYLEVGTLNWAVKGYGQ